MIFSFLMSNSGLGAHLWDLRMRTRIHLSYVRPHSPRNSRNNPLTSPKLYNQATIIYLLLMPILRSGITLQIIRTFVPLGTRNAVFWTGHVLIWLNLLIYFATIVVEFKMCSPRAKKWDPTITGGSCSRGALAVRFFVAFLNVASDVVLLVIPQRAIWRLRMGWGGKGRLSVLFLFGLL